jgi:hypothetical protein
MFDLPSDEVAGTDQPAEAEPEEPLAEIRELRRR